MDKTYTPAQFVKDWLLCIETLEKQFLPLAVPEDELLLYFHEALQDFANRLCAAQRENCASFYEGKRDGRLTFAKQPEVEEI